MSSSIAGIEKARIEACLKAETARFIDRNPRSRQLGQEAKAHFPDGVPMHWMTDWGTPFPLFVAEATGARLTDVDGNAYRDFCLGDTGSMFGHSPAPIMEVLARQGGHGLTYMLPTEDVPVIGRLLAERFGLPQWQVAATATDANRFALRWARAITGRPKILVFNGCYHGTVDETFVRLRDGRVIHRPGLLGQVTDLTTGAHVVEFNDLPALEAALAEGDVACVITEPALTNIGMVLPDEGFIEGVQAACRRTGTLLLIDETHTISTGPGGWTRKHGLSPDFFVVGKAIAGGVPCAVWGFTDAIAAGMKIAREKAGPGHSGMGTTLSANALALRALRANLEQVMTDAAYDHMLAMSDRLAAGIRAVIAGNSLPWHVSAVGARAEFVCGPVPPRNGAEAAVSMHGDLEAAIHLYLMNRGFLIAPFHNMTLTCPATTAEDVDALVACIAAACGDLLAGA
ncbi:aspartate aminotransferase family protein [Zavarzinia aquatilis]|uniref:Aspartate aminotransferase family protein n=1 Tax=Zavarzinia aquatilis TaxID=2211142 RepID=A0A317EJU1_9PROT|nr:aspartate aminotransferase family protein [Zavarzinia aquatilis]PWR25515.1 aspartate aminotransferase family protein [Zavarzinia aquatilis]